jgi:hypothetical protein
MPLSQFYRYRLKKPSTYTRYHSSPTSIIQQPHPLLLDFPSLGPIFLFIIAEVNADPVKTSADLSYEQLRGLLILVGMG